ncbi:MAG: ribonuclease E/G [Lactobacillales bacterium]|jgi:Ribonuclease G/E|nr:ribonuclease E/G [Lactobacillales bacterium]
MRLYQETLAGENRVALVSDDGRIQEIYIQRDRGMDLNDVVPAVIAHKAPFKNGYFTLSPAKESIYVYSKTPLTVGQKVTLKITKEARLGKDAVGTLTDLPPQKAADIAASLSKKLSVPISTDAFDFDQAITDALAPAIILKNGARIHVERTQACSTIDIDSAASSHPFEELNTGSIPEIVRQITLKNLSGLILIDFIGLKKTNELVALTEKIRDALVQDERAEVLGHTRGGLIEIKRGRTYASLSDKLCDGTPYFTALSTYYRIRRHLLKIKNPRIEITAAPAVIQYLQSGEISAKYIPQMDKAPDFFDIKEITK